MSDDIANSVNELIQNVKRDESGKLQFPENADPAHVFAARAEIRRRDTQSSYVKATQTVKALDICRAPATRYLQSSGRSSADILFFLFKFVNYLSPTEQASLEELKTQDPEAWRQKINELEQEKRNKVAETKQTIKKNASKESELASRTALLEEYNAQNPDFQITDDVVQNDLPPRIVNGLQNGSLSFEQFIEEAKKYLQTPKKIDPGEKPPETVDFKSARGSNQPTDEAKHQQNKDDYTKEIF